MNFRFFIDRFYSFPNFYKQNCITILSLFICFSIKRKDKLKIKFLRRLGQQHPKNTESSNDYLILKNAFIFQEVNIVLMEIKVKKINSDIYDKGWDSCIIKLEKQNYQ